MDDGNILSKTTIRLRVWSVCHLQWPRQTGHSHKPRKSVSSQTRLPVINHALFTQAHPSFRDRYLDQGHLLVSTRASSRSVACTYAARRWLVEAWVTVSTGSSILPFGTLGDSFALGDKMLTHANKVASIAKRPATIPQYTHDISHTLACESRESFLSPHAFTPPCDTPTWLPGVPSRRVLWFLCSEQSAKVLQRRRSPA